MRGGENMSEHKLTFSRHVEAAELNGKYLDLGKRSGIGELWSLFRNMMAKIIGLDLDHAESACGQQACGTLKWSHP